MIISGWANKVCQFFDHYMLFPLVLKVTHISIKNGIFCVFICPHLNIINIGEDLDDTFTEATEGCYLPSETISRFLTWRLGGQL